MGSRFNFAGNFGAIGQVEFQRLARDKNVGDRKTRVFYAALGWANQTGHAEFGPGELAQVLDIGYGREANLAVNKAVIEAKKAKLIEPESGARCLVLSSKKFQTGKGGVQCKYHGLHIRDLAYLR